MNSTIPDDLPDEVDGFSFKLTEAQRAKLAIGHTVIIEIDSNNCLKICVAAGEFTLCLRTVGSP